MDAGKPLKILPFLKPEEQRWIGNLAPANIPGDRVYRELTDSGSAGCGDAIQGRTDANNTVLFYEFEVDVVDYMLQFLTLQ